MTSPKCNDTETVDHAGVITELGLLPAGAILDEISVAEIFGRHPASVKRAVDRGELPPSIRLFGKPCWTVRIILEHLDRRLKVARESGERETGRIARMSP